jgi:hypothetical protein
MMKWDGKRQPKYVWLGDEWRQSGTRDRYIAYESGWKHKKRSLNKAIPYDEDVKVFYPKRA